MRRDTRSEYRAERQPAGSAVPGRRPGAVCQVCRALAALPARPARSLDAQPDAPQPRTPPEISEHLLSPGTEHQGYSGRVARLSTGALAGSDSQCGSSPDRARVSLHGAPALLSAFPLRARQQRCSLSMPRSRPPNNSRLPARPQWMRDYFRHARDLYRAAVRELESSEAQNSSLFAQFKDWRTRLSNADFSVSRERVHLRVPHALEADPELALRLFQFVARHGIRPSTETEPALAAVLPQLQEWFSTPRPVWPALKEILSLPYAAEAVRGMHDTGVLRAVFPEMAQIEMPGDSRFLSSLHCGRAHAGHPAGSGGFARQPANRPSSAIAICCRRWKNPPCCSARFCFTT